MPSSFVFGPIRTRNLFVIRDDSIFVELFFFSKEVHADLVFLFLV